MNLEQRLATAAKLEKRGKLTMPNGDMVSVYYGLVYLNRKIPMTWDTFTHIYLLDK